MVGDFLTRLKMASVSVVGIDPLESFRIVVPCVESRVLCIHMQKGLHKFLHISVILFSQKIPVKFSLLAPLPKLGKFLSHEEEFLARMEKHERVGCLQILKLVVPGIPASC